MTATRRAPAPLLALGGIALSLLLPILVAGSATASPVSAEKAHLRDVQARLSKVYAQADAAVERYNQATSRLESVRQQIKENERLLKVAEYNLELAEAQLLDRAQSIYKTRDTSTMDVVFAAASFDELVTQLDMMSRLTRNDVDIVTSIAAYRQDVKDRRLELAADREAAAELVATTGAKKREILALEDKLESMTAGIRADIRRLEAQDAARARRAADIVDPGGSGHSAVVGLAQQQIGKPYEWAGAGPDVFDCSGLVMYCYAQIGIYLPHSATLQFSASAPVPLNALQPGDLVFFGVPGDFRHVGIYAGGGQMIDAPHTGAFVRYDSIAGAYVGGRP